MKIEHKNYLMESRKEGGFDLYQKAIATKKETGEKYDTTHIIGYNMKLENCILKILHLNNCDKNEVVSLKEFIDIYKEQANEIKNLIKI